MDGIAEGRLTRKLTQMARAAVGAFYIPAGIGRSPEWNIHSEEDIRLEFLKADHENSSQCINFSFVDIACRTR